MSEVNLARLIEDMARSLHTEMRAGFRRLEERMGNLERRMGSFDRRLAHADVNITTALEILVRQSRWHQETDANAESALVRIGKLEEDVAAIKRRLPPE
jgi:chromosome segregation ATPase